VNDDSLFNLLNEADRVMERPSLQPDLHGRVIRREQRRKLARRSAAVVAVLLAIIPLMFFRHAAVPGKPMAISTLPAPQPMTSPDTDALDAIVAQKTADAILRLRHQPPPPRF
jgi:hypothetical protein